MFVPVSASLYIMALFVEVAGMVLDEGGKRSTLVTILAALGGFWVTFVVGAREAADRAALVARVALRSVPWSRVHVVRVRGGVVS